jgi:hypothetical protein
MWKLASCKPLITQINHAGGDADEGVIENVVVVRATFNVIERGKIMPSLTSLNRTRPKHVELAPAKPRMLHVALARAV